MRGVSSQEQGTQVSAQTGSKISKIIPGKTHLYSIVTHQQSSAVNPD